MSVPHPDEGFDGERQAFPEEGILPADIFALELQHQLFLGLQPTGLLCRFWTCQPPHEAIPYNKPCMHVCTHIHTSYWLCFSGEPWLHHPTWWYPFLFCTYKQNCIYVKHTSWWFGISIHCDKITTIKLINTSITSYGYLFVYVGLHTDFSPCLVKSSCESYRLEVYENST